MSRYRFRWKHDGGEEFTAVDAENHAQACWRFGVAHAALFTKRGAIPAGFRMDAHDFEIVPQNTFGVCQKCGCTDADCAQCVARTGAPCSWVDESHTLCSACVNEP
jgi:hypothetical protein